MIDLATDWINIHTVPSAQANLVSDRAELAWFTMYPLASKVMVDWENKFLAEVKP